jgi:dCMP deaminase
MRPSWEEYFLEMADLAARRSTCPRRHVGAVLVRDHRIIATGYNGSLRGQPHCTDAGCLMVDGHCKRTVHAELNALLQCAFHGVSSRGASLFTTSFPCLDCAKAVVQSGVTAVHYRDPYPDEHARRMLEDAGVALRGRVPAAAGPPGGAAAPP